MNVQTPFEHSVPQRLMRLRQAMAARHVDALLVPSSDPHLSEYLPGYWQGRQWLSGFHGSVGTLVVTSAFAGLWVDSRYWEQAEHELAGSGIELMKLSPGKPGALEWLGEHAEPNGTVAVDGAVMALASARQLAERLKARGARLVTDQDLLGEVWDGRPGLPGNPVYQHLQPHATTSRAQKLAQLRQAMQAKGADWHFIATLDDIAWLFNLRGSDVSYNPVFLAFALISQQQAMLFVGQGKVDAHLRQVLASDGVEVRDYSEAGQALAAVAAGSRLLVDPARVTCSLLANLPVGVELVEGLNPTTLSKACKGDADLPYIRQVMEEDGAALCEFFAWLEANLGREVVTELTVDEQLSAARARRANFVSLSFSTIAAFNANGAMPHYRATEQSHARIEGNGLLLIDSGGQYLGGTTDITRMVPVGVPSHAQKEDCTRVLKGMIALSRATFPRGILSPLLDAIARAPIWADQVDYGHGTGHGVGYFLNVHEGPQVIAYQAAPAPHTAMQAGMISSIEPGTYRPGQWGVRIENLVVNREAGTSAFGDFLNFETLTLCPIDTRCLLPERLTQCELEWLNGYHAHVRERLAPLLKGEALGWLEARTAPL
ncbi:MULTISPECIES: aminopeptidase P family protein [Pseudomonas]|uniref:Aminopeptidase P family protein n=1 Tax=Pseudomonas juntendi TaxID=2666183 RepID=A0A7W2LT32_9PSED|nr:MULTISPECIES: aminopeptidase P family protein [Pseudomonas]NPA20006.1 aminopeptidase P family protein [Gammaproteobacteria bacterium]MBA6131161.1 aminopeptidase P family protein [Pseudomonas juntendi]MBA6146523.1 aminopeptidase P family protein [Pseudomonas juntendi]MCK2109812.1 aminopeptidase P family protein [Pseudomonas juntendi]MCK2115945.1 aminopeptidase P family protein [Pseudomonas juntendi]